MNFTYVSKPLLMTFETFFLRVGQFLQFPFKNLFFADCNFTWFDQIREL